MGMSRLAAKARGKLLHVAKLDQRLRHWDDERYLRLHYFIRFGKRLDLHNPQSYNAKLQWLKLNHRVPGQWKLVDKYEVKDIVAGLVGEDYVIPTLGVYESFEQIDFDALPSAFVLKCTHDSGGVVVVRDREEMDLSAVRAKLLRSMARNYYYNGREPEYLEIRPRIIAEPFLHDEERGQLLDFKFFCFDGEVRAMFVASDRSSGHVKFDYFDTEFRRLDLQQHYPNSKVLPEKPKRFHEMLELSRELSKGHPHVRVDLYEVNGKVYFGELTFYHFSGLHPFHPASWDMEWGNWLKLPRPVNGA